MPAGEKNQAMKSAKTWQKRFFLLNPVACLLYAAMITGLIGGCASMEPTKELLIQDTDQAYEAGTIISVCHDGPISFEQLIADLDGVRVIYVGEKHTSRSHHEIQLKIIQAVFRQHPKMAVGMEMIDRSYQDILNLWSAGDLDQKAFLRKIHWYANWRYGFSLYADIFDFIKKNHIRLAALNIPFDIPPKIRVGGIENLRPAEKKYLPDHIDTTRADHRAYLKEVFGQHSFKGKGEFEDFYMAQCVWEDTMAEAIARNLKDDVMVVLAGNGHIQFKYGIPDRAFSRTGAAFRTIFLAPAGGKVKLDVADYIWVTK